MVVIARRNIFGASVGDSAAWLFADAGPIDFTRDQQRKPLLGSGQAPSPRGFCSPIQSGTLVIASDGLWKYASLDAIRSRVQTSASAELAWHVFQAERSRMTLLSSRAGSLCLSHES